MSNKVNLDSGSHGSPSYVPLMGEAPQTAAASFAHRTFEILSTSSSSSKVQNDGASSVLMKHGRPARLCTLKVPACEEVQEEKISAPKKIRLASKDLSSFDNLTYEEAVKSRRQYFQHTWPKVVKCSEKDALEDMQEMKRFSPPTFYRASGHGGQGETRCYPFKTAISSSRFFEEISESSESSDEESISAGAGGGKLSSSSHASLMKSGRELSFNVLREVASSSLRAYASLHEETELFLAGSRKLASSSAGLVNLVGIELAHTPSQIASSSTLTLPIGGTDSSIPLVSSSTAPSASVAVSRESLLQGLQARSLKLENVPEEFWQDIEFAKHATTVRVVDSRRIINHYLPKNIINNGKNGFWAHVLPLRPDLIDCVSGNVLRNYDLLREIFKALTPSERNPQSEFMKSLIEKVPLSFYLFPYEAQSDVWICKVALSKSIDNYEFVSRSLKDNPGFRRYVAESFPGGLLQMFLDGFFDMEFYKQSLIKQPTAIIKFYLHRLKDARFKTDLLKELLSSIPHDGLLKVGKENPLILLHLHASRLDEHKDFIKAHINMGLSQEHSQRIELCRCISGMISYDPAVASTLESLGFSLAIFSGM